MKLTSIDIRDDDQIEQWTLEHMEPYENITDSMLHAAVSLRLWPLGDDDGAPLTTRYEKKGWIFAPVILLTADGVLFQVESDDYATPAEGRLAIYAAKRKLWRRLGFLRGIKQALVSDTQQFKEMLADKVAKTMAKG